MTDLAATIIHAVSDAEDRLILAEEPLAGVQLRCGGSLPGTIAVPALLETVRKARRYRLKLARAFTAQDGTHAISAWLEVESRRDGEAGCEIVLRNWRSAPLPAEDTGAVAGLQDEIDRQLSELTARLDAQQRLLAVEAEAPDLADLARAMRTGVGQVWTEFVTIENAIHSQPMHWRLIDGVSVTAAGSERTWRATLLPQMDGQGEPLGFELLLTAAQPLARAAAPVAVTAGRAPVARFGTMGREIAPVLRQPIARIIANAETIRTRLAGPLSSAYAGYAGDIAAAGQHLLGLVEDLSDLEVVEAEDFSTVAEEVDLGEVARQAAGILGVRASEKRITVLTPIIEETVSATGEFRRVLQILLNLIGNAIRYSPDGSRIVVNVESEDGRAKVSVADEGPGLASEDQARVFEKFERLGRSGDGGSGLGLYISRRLARAMKGDLSVKSTIGEGARFVLELAAAPEAEEPRSIDFTSVRRLPRLPRIAGHTGSAATSEPDQR